MSGITEICETFDGGDKLHFLERQATVEFGNTRERIRAVSLIISRSVSEKNGTGACYRSYACHNIALVVNALVEGIEHHYKHSRSKT